MKKEKNLLLICFVAMLMITACKCNPHPDGRTIIDSTNAAVDSAHLWDSLATEEDVHFDTATQHWMFSILNNSSVNAGNFELKYSGDEHKSLGETSAFTPAKNFYKDYKTVLRWSPDSAYIVDFGSYGHMVVKHKNGATSLEGGDPETKVSLINLPKQQESQILFAGPSIKILDVKWLNKDVFAMLYSNAVEAKPDTVLWLINVQDSNIKKYHYNSGISKR